MPKKSPKSETQKPKATSRKEKIIQKLGAVGRKKPRNVSRFKSGERKLEAPKRIWYNPYSWRHRKPVPNYKKLPKARKIFAAEIREFKQNWYVFGGIVLLFGILNLVLVRGIGGSSNLSDIKTTLDSVFHGFGGKLASSALSFTFLVASSGSGNTGSSGVYQVILVIIFSLAFIWALRQAAAKHKVRLRDSFYLGMYPLIPFLLIIGLIAVQLVPLAAGGGIYAAATSHAIAVNWWERSLFIALFVFLGLWTFRMLTATIFAFYIVTLPDMTPMRAYRSARDLVYGRRLYLWRKILFLPVVLFLLTVLIMIPLIMWLTPAAEWAFFVLTMLSLPLLHGYLYKMYREML